MGNGREEPAAVHEPLGMDHEMYEGGEEGEGEGDEEEYAV